jgi:hypothetical protein
MVKRTKNTLPEDVILDLESRLAGTLKPIQPPNEVVQRLRDQIHFPSREEIIARLSDWKRMFLVFGSVMSGMLLIITIARAFYYFVGKKQM